MLGLRHLTWKKALALLALGVAGFVLWEWNTTRLRQKFIAEIEQRGGKVQISDGCLDYCDSHSGPPPPPTTFWDEVIAKFSIWRRKGKLEYLKVPSLLTRRDGERMQCLATVPWLAIDEADDEALAALPELPQLGRLTLYSTKATDAGLICLTQMPLLASLELRGRGFTDAIRIVKHPSLYEIDVTETALSEASFAALVTFPRQLWLSADRIGVTGRDLHAIPAKQIALNGFSVAGNPLTDQALAKLYSAPRLKHADASGIAHGPAALAALAANQTLTNLMLNDMPTDWDALVEAIAATPQLEYLTLEGAQLKPEHLKKLLRLPKLQQLHLDRSNVTSEMYYQVVDELDQQFDDFRHGQVMVDQHIMFAKSSDATK